MAFSEDLQLLEVEGLIRLYELDATKYGGPVFRFHSLTGWDAWDLIHAKGSDSGTTQSEAQGLRESQTIVWNGNSYTPVPLEVSGEALTSTGKASQVNLSILNELNGVKGAVGAYCKLFKDFRKCPFTIITTKVDYLDAVNFPNGNSTASTSEQITHVWYVNQRTSENLIQVTFELTDPINLTGLKLPVRDISPQCYWSRCGLYRSGTGCDYSKADYYDAKGNKVDDPSKDVCPGTVEACKLRFNDDAKPFGGFPVASLLKG